MPEHILHYFSRITHIDNWMIYALALVRFVYHLFIHYNICVVCVQMVMLNHSNDFAGDTVSFQFRLAEPNNVTWTNEMNLRTITFNLVMAH